MGAPGFWDDQAAATRISTEHARVSRKLERYERLRREYDDARELLALGDDELTGELADSIHSLEHELERMQEDALFTGQYDAGDAILEIHAGTGGTDAQDWAEMLLRMYQRWIADRVFDAALLEASPGEEAGVKSATLAVRGENAYGVLKAERGVHRLVRLSPFDAAHRRHTAFAQVVVSPLLPDDAPIELDEAELRSRLAEVEEEKREAELARERGAAQDIGFGSQIRSYVLHPYQLVKDHRTDLEVGNAQSVLDGGLDDFVHSYLLARAAGKVL